MGVGSGNHWNHYLYFSGYRRSNFRTAEDDHAIGAGGNLPDGGGLSTDRGIYYNGARQTVQSVLYLSNGSNKCIFVFLLSRGDIGKWRGCSGNRISGQAWSGIFQRIWDVYAAVCIS